MNWNSLVVEPLVRLLSDIASFIPRLIAVIIILVIGWLIAKVLKELITRGLKTIKLDELKNVNDIIQKGGITYTISELLGIAVYWILMLITLVLAVNAVGLTTAADLLNKIILYIPNVIAAVFILILGFFAATMLSNLVQTVAANAGITQAKLLGKVAEVITVVFAIIITLEQLQITGILIIERIILIILASTGLAVGLAFGLGCKDIAGKYIHDLIEKVRAKK